MSIARAGEVPFVFGEERTINQLLRTTVPDWTLAAPSKASLSLGTAPLHIGRRHLGDGRTEYLVVPDVKLTTEPLYLLLLAVRKHRFAASIIGGMNADLELPYLNDPENKALMERHAKMPMWQELMNNISAIYEVLLEHNLGQQFFWISSYKETKSDLIAADAKALKGLDPETQYNLILEEGSANRTIIIPKPGMEHMHRQELLGMSFQALGRRRLLVRIGSAYKAEISLRRSQVGPHYKFDKDSVVSANFVVPVLRWIAEGAKRSWDVSLLSEEDRAVLTDRLGIVVPDGLKLNPDRFNPLLGVSIIPTLFPELKSSWKDVRGFHESNIVGTTEDVGSRNTMMPVQTLLVLLQEMNTFINNPFIDAAQQHADLE